MVDSAVSPTGNGPPPVATRGTGRAEKALRAGASGLLSLGAVMLLRQAGLVFGDIVHDTSNRVASHALARPIALLLGCFFGVSLIAWIVSRLRAGLVPILIGLLGAGAIGVPRYLATVQPQRAYDFHGVLTLIPTQSWADESPYRPRVTYRVNRFGFRGADFEETKAPGVVRVVLVGDSFTFGMGVEDEGTLKGRLDALFAARGLANRIEVLNAGIAGTQLPTHLRMYDLAQRFLGADVVVMSLLTWNDIATWDWEDEREGISRKGSFFGVLSWLIGNDPATILMTRVMVQHGDDARSLRVLDGLLPRLRERTSEPGAPPLLVVAHYGDPRIETRFRGVPNVDYLSAPDRPGYYIPGDGHPTAEGNARFAELVMERIEKLPPLRAIGPAH